MKKNKFKNSILIVILFFSLIQCKTHAALAASPKVIFRTTAGVIEISFYLNRSLSNIGIFLKVVGIGGYTGTRFHRVSPGFFIQGGDPLSADSDPANDGTGGDAFVTTQRPCLALSEGTIAFITTGTTDEFNTHQFIITTRKLTSSEKNQFRGQYIVLGKVTAGLELVKKISFMQPQELRNIRIISAVVQSQ